MENVSGVKVGDKVKIPMNWMIIFVATNGYVHWEEHFRKIVFRGIDLWTYVEHSVFFVEKIGVSLPEPKMSNAYCPPFGQTHSDFVRLSSEDGVKIYMLKRTEFLKGN